MGRFFHATEAEVKWNLPLHVLTGLQYIFISYMEIGTLKNNLAHCTRW